MTRLGIRWTIGDVADRGFDALRLSVWGARRVFGDGATYRVYVNTVPITEARARAGPLPAGVEWRAVELTLPDWLADRLDAGLAEGVAWKFVPLRAFPDRHELALDNDVVLWARPRAIDAWLAGHAPFVFAEDVVPAFGRFADRCGDRPLNTGIRGLPPGFDLEPALRGALGEHTLTSELDEQGLQVAALRAAGAIAVVTLDEVTICSPFPPHLPELGAAGAHFVGINARRIPFEFDGRPAIEVRAEHWDQRAAELARRTGAGA